MIGVIADDLTGAHDIGSMFAKSGALVHVFTHTALDEPADYRWDEPDVLILDTNSRFDTPSVAYTKVLTAARRLRELGCTKYYKKICSAFRGNIGPELDAMLRGIDEDFAVVVPGFPKNGRQTIHGIHYIHGIPLAESEFRLDPVHPMTESNLVEILQGQTEGRVALVDHSLIEKGPIGLRAEVERLEGEYQYAILDVVNQDSLEIIAEGLRHLPIFSGSSALAEELPIPPKKSPTHYDLAVPKKTDVGILCVAGSLTPQTKAQVEHMKERGAPALELSSLDVLTDRRKLEIERLVAQASPRLGRGEDVLIHTAYSPEVVTRTVELGRAQGLSTEAVSRSVSEALAEVVNQCVYRAGVSRLVLAGGDTAASICARLKTTGMQIGREIEPGIPSCISLGDLHLFMVLKPGSFGGSSFFTKACRHLRGKG
ncbi:MAG: four-carbon acid sugar kinase family protein [Firmicutes bacterium]|nr:four-carbon acid sugar kinase family protein [Bacillota bacterium]